MQTTDDDVSQCEALVVDGNSSSRSLLVAQLRAYGYGSVRQAARLTDARQMLEERAFDLVVCDYHFDDSDTSGQDLLEELRRENLMPLSTVFVMITSEATYARVAEAAEAALDSFLIKPFSAARLEDRIVEARQRKRILGEIYRALESQDHEQAADLCLKQFAERGPYWLYAARVGAELLLRLKRTDEARTLYDAVIAAKAVPWARLGVARVQLAKGDMSNAQRTLEALLGDLPEYADSYDVLGKVQMEQGQLDAALQTYRTAARITPGCILRLQHCGTLNFYAGDARQAAQMLEKTWSLGSRSRLFDVLSMSLLALLRFDDRDSKGLGLACDVLARFANAYPKSIRLRRFKLLGQALTHLLAGRTGSGIALARELAAQADHAEFDLEAGMTLLCLWSRLGPHGVDDAECEALFRKLGQRFSVSKTSTEVLVAAAGRRKPQAQWLREAHAGIMNVAEQAMGHAMNGRPKTGVEMLLTHGETSFNAKLIEMAGLVARRHRQHIDGIEPLLARADGLSKRFCVPATHIAGVRRSNRSAGGLVLRH